MDVGLVLGGAIVGGVLGFIWAYSPLGGVVISFLVCGSGYAMWQQANPASAAELETGLQTKDATIFLVSAVVVGALVWIAVTDSS